MHHLDPGVFRDRAIVSMCIWAPRPWSFDQTITILSLYPQVRILSGCLSWQQHHSHNQENPRTFFPRNQLSCTITIIGQRYWNAFIIHMCWQTVFYAAVPCDLPCWHLCISTRWVLPDAARAMIPAWNGCTPPPPWDYLWDLATRKSRPILLTRSSDKSVFGTKMLYLCDRQAAEMVCFVQNVSCFSGETLSGSIFKQKTIYPAASSTGGDGTNTGLMHRVNQSRPH